MAFDETRGNGMYMPVAPAYGNGGGFMNGGDGWWIILLLLACGGGWGMGGFGGGWGGMMGMGIDFPWLMNGQQNIMSNDNGNYRDAMINDGITGIRGSLGDIQTQLCGGFAGVTASVTNAQNALAQQMYTNQISDLERSFAAQTANTAGFNGVQSILCDIRYGNATNTREILTALNQGVQSIKDQLCQDKIDAKNDEIAQLRQENLYARGQASQIAQNGTIINGVYDRLSQCPVGTVPVFGNQPIFTCSGTNGCGCSGNGFAN